MKHTFTLSVINITRHFIAVLLLLTISTGLIAQSSKNFTSGSFIVNMGIVPQTVGNALKPYGLVYDLVKNFNVPVYKIIAAGKVKDGIDFTYLGVQYKGGTFIVPKEYISNAVLSRITFWQTQGVVGVFSTSALTLDFAYRITYTPNWTLDAQNGSIATAFFANAGIPTTAYNWQSPQLLGVCNDVFVMPHADPKWATHSNLLTWNQNQKGSIWAGCHAVSALENMYNPANTDQQTNFLSVKVTTGTGIILPVSGSTAYAQNSLVLWGNHANASIPYTTTNPTELTFTQFYNPKLVAPNDPVAQYMGTTDAAQLNGSEQVYLPVNGGGWRSGTRIVTYDPTQANVPAISAGPAAIIAYGRGFGVETNGWVMYEAAHNIAGTSAAQIAAQRAFFNWSYLTTVDKIPSVNSVSGIPSNGIFASQPAPQTYNLSVITASPMNSTISSVTWSCKRADNGADFGSFTPNGTAAAVNTVFTPTSTSVDVQCIITVRVVDACGRTNFDSYSVVVSSGPRPPVAMSDFASISGTCVQPGTSVTLNVLSNDYDPDGDPIYLTSLGGNKTGSFTIQNKGTFTFTPNSSIGDVTFTPAPNFMGSTSVEYQVCDKTTGGLCSTATITVGVGTPDGNGCYPGTTFGLFSTLNATTATITTATVTYPNYATGPPDYDNTLYTTYAVIGTSGVLTLDFGAIYAPPAYEYLTFYFASSTEGTTASVNVSYSTDGTNFSTPVSYSTTSNIDGAEFTISVPTAGIRYLRIARTAGTVWFDAAQLENWDCVTAMVEAIADVVSIREDTPTEINVLANDKNPGSLPLTVTITTNPTQGQAKVTANNTILYQPNKDNKNNDVLTYQICNSQGLCSSTTLTLNKIADDCSPGSYRPLAATTSSISLNPDADSWFKEDSGGNDIQNGGTGTTLEIGKKPTKERRGIFRFDLSTIPASSSIISAQFQIVRTGGDGDNLTLGAYQIMQGSGNIAQTWTETQVTWLHRNKSTPTFWATAGGSIASTPVSTVASAGNTTGNPNGIRTFDITPLASFWYSNSSLNYGLVVRNETSTIDKRHIFGSRENTALLRPVLNITYKTQAACATIPNYAPLARRDYTTTSSAVSILIPVLSNDFDMENAALTIINPPVSITSQNGYLAGVAGTYTSTQVGIAVVESGQIRFTPNTGFTGTAVIRYQISDGSLTDESFVYVTVTNAAPKVVNDAITVVGNSSGNAINVLSNDSNPDGPAPLTISIVTPPTNGTATLSSSSVTGTATLSGANIIYTPTPNYTGTDILTYRLCEPLAPTACSGESVCTTGTLTITVSNTAPVANNDSYTILPCKETRLNIISNDTDAEGGVLTVTITQQPASGTLVVNTDGSVSFTPATNSASPVTFKYRVTDNGNPPMQSSEATVTLTIANPVNNQAPVAKNDTIEMNWNSTDVIPVMDNDSDPDGQELTIPVIDPGTDAQTQAPLHGTYKINMNGTIDYTPNENYNGYDSLKYKICDRIIDPATCAVSNGLCDYATVIIKIVRPNSPPLAVDDAYTFPANSTSSGSVAYNDSDPENNLLTFAVVNGGTATTNGTLVFNPDGTFTFTPNTGVTSGTFWFDYQVCDNGTPQMCDVGTATITIVPVSISGTVFNDANGLSGTPINTIDGVGINMIGTTPLYAYLVNSSGNISEKVAVQPGGTYAFGTAQPNTSYTVTISTQNVTVGSTSSALSPALPTGWIATGYSYGTGNSAGTGIESGTPNLSIAVTTGTTSVSNVNFGIQRPPVAENDSYTVLAGSTLSGQVLLNDTDGEGSNLTVVANTNPSAGTLVLNSNGTFTYTPPATVTADTDYTFTYTVRDPAGAESTATVTIKVKPCETAPVTPGIIRRM